MKYQGSYPVRFSISRSKRQIYASRSSYSDLQLLKDIQEEFAKKYNVQGKIFGPYNKAGWILQYQSEESWFLAEQLGWIYTKECTQMLHELLLLDLEAYFHWLKVGLPRKSEQFRQMRLQWEQDPQYREQRKIWSSANSKKFWDNPNNRRKMIEIHLERRKDNWCITWSFEDYHRLRIRKRSTHFNHLQKIKRLLEETLGISFNIYKTTVFGDDGFCLECSSNDVVSLAKHLGYFETEEGKRYLQLKREHEACWGENWNEHLELIYGDVNT